MSVGLSWLYLIFIGLQSAWRSSRVLALGPRSSWTPEQLASAVRAAGPGSRVRVLLAVASTSVALAVVMAVRGEGLLAATLGCAAAAWFTAAVLRGRVVRLLGADLAQAVRPPRGPAGMATRVVTALAAAVLLGAATFLPDDPSGPWLMTLGVSAALCVVGGGALFWFESWLPTQGKGVPLTWRGAPAQGRAAQRGQASDNAPASGATAEQPADIGACGAVHSSAAPAESLRGPFTTRRSREQDR